MLGYASRRADAWSSFRFDEETVDAVAAILIERANAMGFELPRAAIHKGILTHADAIKLSVGGGTESSEYIQYPIETRASRDEPVTYRESSDDALLRHLHTQRWRAMRNAAREAGGAKARNRHFDAGTLARWVMALATHSPERVKSYAEFAHDDWRHCIEVTARIDTNAGVMLIDKNEITLPFALPETIRIGITMKNVGDLMDMSGCGDDAIDAEMRDCWVQEATTPDGKFRKTVLKLITRNKPVDPLGASEPWRALKAVREMTSRVLPAYERTDLVRTREEYHARCNEALKTTCALPIPYPDLIQGDGS